MSHFLDFLFNNNSMIIQVLIPAVLVLVLFLAYRSFSMDDDEETTSSGGMSSKELEATLAKVLERANAVPTPAVALQMDGVKNDEQAQKLLKEIERLKAELDSAKANLDQAKAQSAAAPAAAAAGGNAGDDAKLKAQLEEMKAKLGEYEIIAEDIADLSFYKEQAAKLQKEIDALKGGKPAAAPAPVDPAIAALALAEEEIAIAGSAKATEGSKEPTPPPAQPEPVPPTPEPPGIPNAPEPPGPVQEPEPKMPPTSEPEPLPPAIQGAATVAMPAATAEKKEEAYEDILAEFNAVVEEKTGKKIDDLGDLDMDKMLKEAANIKVDVPEVTAEQALGVELDEKKLIAEAADLDKAVSSEDQKLMGQFEKFVKNE